VIHDAQYAHFPGNQLPAITTRTDVYHLLTEYFARDVVVTLNDNAVLFWFKFDDEHWFCLEREPFFPFKGLVGLEIEPPVFSGNTPVNPTFAGQTSSRRRVSAS
jgi:hypothetical protein